MRRALPILLALVAAFVIAGPVLASEQRPTLGEIENEVNCPTCHTILALSNAPIAERMRQFISRRIAAGDTKSEIEDKLVAEFGEGVLAEPPASGFNLVAWVLPFVGIGLAAVAIGFLIVRWRRSGRAQPAEASTEEAALNGHRKLDPELERRLDEELARYDA